MEIYLRLFWEFFKIGLFTFGGGLAMVPLVKDAVISNQWLSETEFYNFIGVCESTPGPIAINMATYVGASQASLLGSIVAVLGVVLPSFIIILIIAKLLNNFVSNKYFKAFIKGVQPVIVALLMATGLILLVKCFGYVSAKELDINIVSILSFIFVLLVNLIYTKVLKKKLNTIFLILLAAVFGVVASVIIL